MAFTGRRSVLLGLLQGRRAFGLVSPSLTPAVAPVRPVTLHGRRQYSSGASSLAAALEKELPDAQSQVAAAPALPQGFTILDREGYNLVTLKGTFGSEQVVVQFSIPRRLEFDIPADQLKLPFDVLIKKSGKGVIEAQCTTCDNGYELEQVAFFDEKDKKIAEEETADADFQRDLRYSGPHLEDLEGAIQDGLAAFLQDKGITVDLARFIQNYIKGTKEPAEYARWVAGLLKFVK